MCSYNYFIGVCYVDPDLLKDGIPNTKGPLLMLIPWRWACSSLVTAYGHTKHARFTLKNFGQIDDIRNMKIYNVKLLMQTFPKLRLP